MLRRLSWRLEPHKGLILVSREHVLLYPTVHEEDPRHLDHSLRVEVEEMLASANKEDEEMEDDVVVDGTAVVEVDK